MTDQKTTPEFPFNGVDVFYGAIMLLILLNLSILGWLLIFGAYGVAQFFAATLLTLLIVWIAGAVTLNITGLRGKVYWG